MTATTDRAKAPSYDYDEGYRCPTCESRLTRDHESWACGDCGYVPHHPAD